MPRPRYSKGAREARVSAKGSVRVQSAAHPKPLDAPPVDVATPLPAPERETIGAASRRHGMPYVKMWRILADAGVFTPGAGVVPPLPVEAIDRAIRAHRGALQSPSAPSTREPPRDATPGAAAPARPVNAHLADAEGRVACGPCWSIAVITRGRVTTCRWCRGSASW